MTPLIKLRGTLALVGITLNTLIMAPLLYLFALLRLCLPLHRAQVVLARVLVVIAESWMAVNNAIIGLTSGVRWRVEGMEGLGAR